MAEVTGTIEIGRSRNEVWAALADFGAISSWASNVDHSSMVTAAAEGEGAARRVQVGRNALLERVIDWTPDHTLSYEIEGLPPMVRFASNTWRLRGNGDTTTATLTTAIDVGPRQLQRAIAWIVANAVARASRGLLTDVKNHLEDVPS